MIAAVCMPPTVGSQKDDDVKEGGRAQFLAFLVPMLLILVGFSTALVCILYDADRKTTASRAASESSGSMMQLLRRFTDQKPPTPSCSTHLVLLPAHLGLQLIYLLFLNPLIAFSMQILLAILSAVLVLTQKFARPSDQKTFCGLQGEGDNVWGFGQTLSVAMLLLPVLSAFHTYLEGRHDIREG